MSKCLNPLARCPNRRQRAIINCAFVAVLVSLSWGWTAALAGSIKFTQNAPSDFDHGRQTVIPLGFGDGEFTLELWIKPDDSYPIGSTAELPDKLINWSNADNPCCEYAWWWEGNFLLDGHNNLTGNGTFSLQFYGSGRLRWHFYDDASSWFLQGASANPTQTPYLLDAVWHHIALVRRWSGNTEADLELWIDGRLIDRETSWDRTDMRTYWNTWNGFGADQAGWFWGTEKQAVVNENFQYEDYKGWLDELRFWSRAKSSDELQNAFRNSVSGNENGLAGRYSFSETAGSRACNDINGADCFDLIAMKPGFRSPQDAPLDAGEPSLPPPASLEVR